MAEQEGTIAFGEDLPRQERGADFDQRPKEEQIVDVGGGVHSAVEPYYLQENQFYGLKNANLDTLGTRRKRTGCESIGTAGLDAGGIGSWVTDDQTRYLIGVWDNHLFKTTGNDVWTQADYSGLSLMDGDYSLIQGQVYVASTPTVAQSAVFLHSYNPLTDVSYSPLWIVTEDDAVMMATFYPRAVTWWQGRLWMGNMADAVYNKDTLMWSNILDGGTIDGANNIDIAPDQGDEIVAIVPTRGTEARLYIFKKRSIYALDVVWAGGAAIPSTENSLDTTNSRLVLISEDVGCVAPKTVVYSSGSGKSDIFFLAADGVRSLQRVEQDVAGGAGEAISEPINDVIDRINWTYAYRAHAAVFDHKMFLAIPVDGSTTVNLMVVFDLIKKVWIGEYTLSPNYMTSFDFTDNSHKFYGLWDVATTEYINDTNPTSGAHVFEMLKSDEYYDPSQTSIQYQEQSRAFIFGNYGMKKTWNWVELMMEPAGTDATVSIYAKVDELDYQLVEHIALSPEYAYPVLPEQLPWNFLQQVPSFKRVGLSEFPAGQKIQIKIESESPSSFGIRATRVSAWPLEEIWE